MPFGSIGKFRFCRLLPDGTMMSVMRCKSSVNVGVRAAEQRRARAGAGPSKRSS